MEGQMIGVAIAGSLVCAFAAGYCLAYVIHKRRREKLDEELRESLKPRRNANGTFAK